MSPHAPQVQVEEPAACSGCSPRVLNRNVQHYPPTVCVHPIALGIIVFGCKLEGPFIPSPKLLSTNVCLCEKVVHGDTSLQMLQLCSMQTFVSFFELWIFIVESVIFSWSTEFLHLVTPF